MHAMIDIETLDTARTSKMLAIGAVKFNAEGIHDGFSCAINLDRQKERTISHDTVMFWFQQKQEARDAVLLDTTLNLYDALFDLFQWLVPSIGSKIDSVWSNHTNFDLAIIEDAAEENGLEIPWKFYQVQDYATIRDAYKRSGGKMNQLGVSNANAHGALADAEYQAKVLIEIFRRTEGMSL